MPEKPSRDYEGCPACDGTGIDPNLTIGREKQPCPVCSGTGFVLIQAEGDHSIHRTENS